MPFDSSGTFNRDHTWASDAAANIKIRADIHDTHDTDIANGLSSCITKNGSTQPTANIPMNSKRIINLAQPTSPQDAATKKYVDDFRVFPTSISISGANAYGQVIFTSPTGANGLSWINTGVDMSFVGRPARTNEITKQLVINNKMDASANLGGDVFRVDERGAIGNNGQLVNNLSWDGSKWRTIVPGYGALLDYHAGGDLRLSSNDVASITNPYVAVTLREFFSAQNAAGSSLIRLAGSGSGKTMSIAGLIGTEHRWLMYLGDGTAESGTARVGSNFQLRSYDNAGANPVIELSINRSTHLATFAADVTAAGDFTSNTGIFQAQQASGKILYLCGGPNGSIYFRPNGPGSTAEQTYIDANGDLRTSNDIVVGLAAPASYGSYLGAGLRSKGSGTAPNSGSAGAYGSHWMNFYWDGSDVKSYVNTSFVGDIAWQCDYRIKKDIEPLPSTWEAVKQLRPIRYTQAAYDIWTEDDRPRWGFIAHELQEKLFAGAASGVKDGPEIQTPNFMAIIAGLTRALQEAMQRIEALEAA